MDNTSLNLIVQVPVVIGTLGLWYQKRKRKVAPLLGFISEIAYLLWSLWFHLWGFIPWSIIWAALYARTWLFWKRDHASG